VDDVAARTRTTKRMIYYYFGSKEQLYAAVLEHLYGGMRDAEQALRLGALPPLEALRRMIEVTFDHHAGHPEFVRLVSVENIHSARIVAASPTIRERNAAVIGTLAGADRAWRGGGRVPGRARRARPAHADQRVLLLPRVEPPYPCRHLRA
jgi:AcrR family transcriptional regulator